jgi:ribose transport system substrate-binding protein
MAERSFEKRIRRQYIILVFTVIFVVTTLVLGALLFRFYMTSFKTKQESNEYDKYYVMITDNYKSDFWQSVYKGAQEAAREEGIFVELLGQNISGEYSCEELMRIAIAARTDGIIVYANESDEMTQLIDEAVSKNIPVVTLYSDNTRSSRMSFVGVGNYNIGREYGKQINNIVKEKRRNNLESDNIGQRTPLKIAVLVNPGSSDAAQNLIISALQDALHQVNITDSEYNIIPVTVDNTNAFSVEESIRDIFMQDPIPDVIMCLNELNTVCAYQAVVDFNKVGEVYILGYYNSDAIVNAVERGVLYATISIDTNQLGEYAVNALNEYYELGNTSQYFTADITLINKDNVEEYLNKEEGDE